VACAVSWLVVLLGLPALARRAWQTVRFEVLLPFALALVAFAVRISLPWGPLNFVDAERLGPLWLLESWPDPLFAAVPTALDGLVSVGFSPRFLMHFWGPTFGALAVVATYAAARTFKTGVPAAAVAASFVAFFPAHIHFSTGPVLSIEAGALCVATLALAASEEVTLLSVLVLVALTTLGVYARPECRLLVLPVAILTTRSGWSWKHRAMLAGLLLVALGAYVPLALAPSTLASPVPECMKRFGLSIVRNPVSFGALWIVAAIAGLAFGKSSLRPRVALGAFLLLVAITDAIGGSDPSPQWGQWRYFVVLVPVVAVSAAILIARFPRLAHPLATLGFLALAAAPVLGASRTLQTPNDQQAEYAFARDTSTSVVDKDGTVYLFRSADTGAPQSATLLALASALGPFEGIQWGCKFPLPPSPALRVRILDEETLGCPDWIRPHGSVLLLDASNQNNPLLDALRKRYAVLPLTGRSQRVVMDSPRADGQATCSAEKGLAGPTEVASFGWYQLHPLVSAP
jgi:hypothetical protein